MEIYLRALLALLIIIISGLYIHTKFNEFFTTIRNTNTYNYNDTNDYNNRNNNNMKTIMKNMKTIMKNNKNNKNKVENFFSGMETPILISEQITIQIAAKLGITARRIQNLVYVGNLEEQKIGVSFTILDPNIVELNKGEANALTIAANANTLFQTNNFIIRVNDTNINLFKIKSNSNKSNDNTDLSAFYNNTSLLDIAKYANNKYVVAPTDETLTHFYNLEIDKNFNVIPVI
jgi:hypothetical protein